MIHIRSNNCNCDNDFNNCNNSFGDSNCCCNNNWGNWGRWVLLAAIIVFFFIVAVGFACINARRRRRLGMAPRYGTGWAAGKTPIGQNAPRYNNYNQGNPAPPYTAPPIYGQNTGNTFNSNDGYYGQQSGVELQQPQHVYQQQPYREPAQYAPPTGNPPTKN